MKQAAINLTSLGIALAAGTLAAQALLPGFGVNSGEETDKNREFLKVMPSSAYLTHSKKTSAGSQPILRAAQDFLLYENFEDAPDEPLYSLPEGWISFSTPGYEDDKWKCGSLFTSKGQLMGSSGSQYAFLLPNDQAEHDSWMFTTTVELEGGKLYNLVFNEFAVSGAGGVDKLEVYLADAPDPNANLSALGTIEDILPEHWETQVLPIAPTETKTYYLGFHAVSPRHTGGICLDDVTVCHYDSPVFSAEGPIEFGEILTNESGEYETEYEIMNTGSAEMSLALKECSPEITVEGLPLEVYPWETISLKIKLHTDIIGTYSGYIVLRTNVPNGAEIRIPVSAQIEEKTEYQSLYETFDIGGSLSGWKLTEGSAVVPGNGLNKTRSFYSTSETSLMNNPRGVGFTTPYVIIDSDSRLAFQYRLEGVDMNGNPNGVPQSSDRPRVKVDITEDNEQTWTTVYIIEPGGEHEFDGQLGYHPVSIDLSQFAGKSCRARVLVSHAKNDVMDIMTNPMLVLIDNVRMGTLPDKDMAVTHMFGNASYQTGETVRMNINVENQGAKEASDYTVDLLDNTGKVLGTVTGEVLASGESKNYTLEWQTDKSGTLALKGRVNLGNNLNKSNGESFPVYVSVLDPAAKSHTITTQREDSIVWGLAAPINLYSTRAMTQSIYWANELGCSHGYIQSLKYKTSGPSKYASEEFDVYIGETDRYDYDNNNTFVKTDDLTKVFSGRAYFDVATQDFVIAFDKPYEYSGRNLVIEMRKEGKEFVYGQGFKSALKNRGRTLSVNSDEGDKGSAIRVLPEVTINIMESPSGTLQGKVADDTNTPVEGVELNVEGTCITAYTDAQGLYSIQGISSGKQKIKLSAKGYNTIIKEVEIEADKVNTYDFTISNQEKYEFSGKITDADNAAVAGAVIKLSGESEESVTTDENGLFTVALFNAKPYSMRIEHPYYEPATGIVELNGAAMNRDYTLDNQLLEVSNLQTSVSAEKGIVISWEEPNAQLRHDSGIFSEGRGFPGGNKLSVFGSVYRERATIEEISWYMVSNEQGMEHDHFNVYIFGLEDGIPNVNDMLYSAMDVEWRDNAWNFHKLTKPVTADGFMIAISCDGFMGIGMTPVTDEYPYVPDTEYYADTYTVNLTEMSRWTKDLHFMLRAGYRQDDNLFERPSATYQVYRASEGSDDWKELAEISERAFTDKAENLADGTYVYRIVSKYVSGNSEGRISSPVIFAGNGIESVTDNEVVSREYLTLDGMIMSDRPSQSGIYVIRETLASGIVRMRKVTVK